MKKIFSLLFILLLFSLGSSNNAYASASRFDQNNPPDMMKDFEMLRKRVKQNPRDIAAINSLGIIYARAGKLDDATRLWKYALDLDPAYIHLYNNLGSALKQQGRREEARIVFKTGLSYSTSYWIHYNLGLLEKEDGNLVAAANCFKSCLASSPGFQPALKQLAELGYQVQMPDSGRASHPLSLGSYKPPVETGNIDFYPLFANGRKQESKEEEREEYANVPSPTIPARPTRTNISKPFTPLSSADCSEIIKSFKAEPKDRYIALTFDDGPHSSHTPEILDILKREGAKATFFVVGSRAETYPDIVSRISAEGHDVGNHTWDHRSLAKSSKSDAMASLRRTNDMISGITTKACNIVRPPFGHTNSRVKTMLHSEGWHEIMWDSDSRDWQNKNPDMIFYRVMKSVSPGSIVLFHDIHPGAALMLPTMIRAFKAQGYRFITISDLIRITTSAS